MNRRFLLSQDLSSGRFPGVHNRSYKGVNQKPDTGGTCSHCFLSLNGPKRLSISLSKLFA
ncbi:hypothetical protein ACFRAM_06310 [Paenibacillus sp. NPDC056722]|uniref:hypothetical protein n=1 Tax=Paenibacillus sp. NPDC056722 TaxID=3345924 RepID=UPI0036C47459